MERKYKLCKISISEVSKWKKTDCGEKKVSNFWVVDIDNGMTKTGFRVDSKTQLLERLREELCMVKSHEH